MAAPSFRNTTQSASTLQFTSNSYPTIGVEIELQLVDLESMALKSVFNQVVGSLPEKLTSCVKQELMQCCLELNTNVCRSVGDAEKDLTEKVKIVQEVAKKHGAGLFWGATHPFSTWSEQKVSDNERYHMLVDLLQETARRLVTFGLHVHVGVDSGDKAIMICDRLMRHLPTLMALSSNSPFWNGRNTGLHSQRSKVMELLPTAGLPPLMRNWSEYVWLIKHMINTGFINTIREIWWDVRPHHSFGTVEVRICDMPASIKDVMSITAIIQCLVYALSKEIDDGTYQFDCHPMMVRQNKWRACRFGMGANLVDAYTAQSRPAREVVWHLIDLLLPFSERLECTDYLLAGREMARNPTGSERQLAIFQKTNSHAEVVRRMMEESQL